MPATALDSLIFRDIFTTPEMRHVFSDEARTGYYLEIEAALGTLFSRLPDMRITNLDDLRWHKRSQIRGVESLQIARS